MVCAVAVLSAAGCADGSASFASSTATHFTPGVTTRADAVAALGPPSSVYEAANGDKTIAWASDGGLFNPGETRQVSILFGSDDKMIRILAQP